MHTVKPAPTQLFCKAEEAETVTKSGFLLTTKSEAPKIAQVINIGDKVTSFQQKDRVVYKPYATNEIKLDGVDYFLIDEEDVMGTVVEVDG